MKNPVKHYDKYGNRKISETEKDDVVIINGVKYKVISNTYRGSTHDTKDDE